MKGHIDALIRRLIEQHNVPLHVAYRVASWSTARHFGLESPRLTGTRQAGRYRPVERCA